MIHTMLGCPIRKSTDQSLLTAPRSLSQSSTSFIASYSLGIHHSLLIAYLFEFSLTHHFLAKCNKFVCFCAIVVFIRTL